MIPNLSPAQVSTASRITPHLREPLRPKAFPGRRIGVYTAEPGTLDHDALALLDLTAPATRSSRL